MQFLRPFYRWRPGPWHGLDVGPEPPRLFNAYIEINPCDVMTNQVEKEKGYRGVDRQQRSSSLPLVLYGFIPRTNCGRGMSAPCDTPEHADRPARYLCCQ